MGDKQPEDYGNKVYHKTAAPSDRNTMDFNETTNAGSETLETGDYGNTFDSSAPQPSAKIKASINHQEYRSG